MAEITKEEREAQILLEAYKLYMARYNAVFPAFYEDLKFYAGLIAAILGGTILLLKEDLRELPSFPGWFALGILVVAGAATKAVSAFGRLGIQHSYKAWLATISSLAKLESDIGLHNSREGTSGPKSRLWSSESIVFPAHRSHARTLTGSTEFVTRFSKTGYRGTAEYFFTICSWIGLVMITCGIAAGLWKISCAAWKCPL